MNRTGINIPPINTARLKVDFNNLSKAISKAIDEWNKDIDRRAWSFKHDTTIVNGVETVNPPM